MQVLYIHVLIKFALYNLFIFARITIVGYSPLMKPVRIGTKYHYHRLLHHQFPSPRGLWATILH